MGGPDTHQPDLARRAILPSGLARVVLALVIAAALVVAVLGALVHDSSEATAPDRALSRAVWTVWPSGPLAYAVDGLVTLVPVGLTMAALAAAGWLSGQRRLAGLALLGPFCVVAATTLLKPLVARTIHGDNLSFPSGHTAYATYVGLLVGLLLVGRLRPARTGWAALLLVVPTLIFGGFMAMDQISLDAHYPSDTLGGFCTAVAVVLVLALALDRVIDRWGSA